THLQPGDRADTEARRLGDVESAVAIEDRGVRAVLFEPFFADDHHRNAGAVFALVKNLLGFELFGVESDFGLTKYGALARFYVVAVDRAGDGVACEGIERLTIVASAGEAADAAQVG